MLFFMGQSRHGRAMSTLAVPLMGPLGGAHPALGVLAGACPAVRVLAALGLLWSLHWHQQTLEGAGGHLQAEPCGMWMRFQAWAAAETPVPVLQRLSVKESAG